MKKVFSIFIAILAWFAVLTQYYLMVENPAVSIGETTIRFFSYFTILTNSLVAIYFTLIPLRADVVATTGIHRPGTLTAITIYITMVGITYQVILRHTWQPTGLQMIVDEILHTLIPIVVIVYWYLYENKSLVTNKKIPQWLAYPLIYLVFILIRGKISNFYPYPFVNASELGLANVLLNSFLLIVLFLGISILFIRVGKSTGYTRQ